MTFKFYDGYPHINPQQRYRDNNRYLKTLERDSKGSIDKIEFYLEEMIKFSDLEKVCQKYGYKAEMVRMPETKGWSYRITDIHGGRMSFLCFNKNAHSSKKISVRPSDFYSYKYMAVFITRIIGRNQFECTSIYRIDFAVDIPDYFDCVKEYFCSPKKGLLRVYLNNGHRVNGLQVGGSPDRASAYDKALESGVAGPLTRIEVQKTGSEKLVDTLSDLPKLIQPQRDTGNFLKAFKRVQLEGIRLINFDQIKTKRELIRFIEIRTLKSEMGGQLVRKKFGSTTNFLRECGRFVEFEKYPVDLDKVILRDLCKYFERPSYFTEVIEPMWDSAD